MPPDGSISGGPTKRKRLQGACDNCRRKKARCDSSVMPDKRCSNCLALGAECTHLYANQKHAQILSRTPLKTAVEGASSGSLGEYREKMNGLLQAVLSSTYQAPSHPAILRDSLVSLARYGRALEEILPEEMWASTPVPSKYEPPPPIITNGGHAPSTDEDEDSGSEEVEDEEMEVVPDHLLSPLFLQPGEDHFFGPSSGLRLLATALEFKEEYYRNPQALKSVFEKYKRPHFWVVHPWEDVSSRQHQELLFPDADLIEQLLEVYFSKIHIFAPFLHRHSIEHSVRIRAYLTDADVGVVVLAICALASRYSNDRRVFDANVTSELGCGYHWFQQVAAFLSVSKSPTLHSVQACYMIAMYAFSSAATEKAWYLIGMATRAAEDLGLHRSTRSGSKPTILSELRNRLWWAITVAEHLISVQCGRPCSIQPWDYDIELPIECDDEYWEHRDSELQFSQPSGRLSYVTHFVKIIELFTILGSVQRSMYPSRNQARPGDRASLSELDVALGCWEKSIPSHLRLGGRYNDATFEYQAVSLWMSFYYVQMLTHRPFLSRRQIRSSSVGICINAARACSRVMEGQTAGSPLLTPAIEMPALSMAGMVLIMDVWRRDITPGNVDSSEEIRGVHRCISALKLHEARNAALGRRVDLLFALLAASRLPLPPDSDNRTEPMVLLLAEPRAPNPVPQPPRPRHDHAPLNTYEAESRAPVDPSTPQLTPPDDGRCVPSRGRSRRDAPGSDCWLDLLTDPNSLRDRGHSFHELKPPPPPPVHHRYSSANASNSAVRTHSSERRPVDRYQPFPTSSSTRRSSNPSNLRYVNMFHDASEGRLSMDVDENAPASVKRASTLLQCGPNGIHGPGSSASKHASQLQVHSPISASLPPLSPNGSSDGHWRNPYVYDVAPS